MEVSVITQNVKFDEIKETLESVYKMWGKRIINLSIVDYPYTLDYGTVKTLIFTVIAKQDEEIIS